MKTLLKYITLLIFSGVIIPLYQPLSHTIKPGRAIPLMAATPAIAKPATHNGAFHLYFIYDVIAKLLPVADFLK